MQNELDELETSICYYRVAERELLKIRNFGDIQSVIVDDIIDSLLEFFDNWCETLADAMYEINNQEHITYAPQAKEIDDKEVSNDVIKSIFKIVARGVEADLPLSHDLFKHIVKDLEHVLDILGESKTRNKKTDVEKYFKDNCNMHVGMVVCQNCNRAMLAEIPYCFICFSGRYS